MARKRVKLAPPVKKNQKRKQKVARNEEVYDDKSNKTIVDASVLSKATMLELADSTEKDAASRTEENTTDIVKKLQKKVSNTRSEDSDISIEISHQAVPEKASGSSLRARLGQILSSLTHDPFRGTSSAQDQVQMKMTAETPEKEKMMSKDMCSNWSGMADTAQPHQNCDNVNENREKNLMMHVPKPMAKKLVPLQKQPHLKLTAKTTSSASASETENEDHEELNEISTQISHTKRKAVPFCEFLIPTFASPPIRKQVTRQRLKHRDRKRKVVQRVSVPCEEYWQPEEGEILPEPSDTSLPNVHIFARTKCTCRVFRFGSMYFAVSMEVGDNGLFEEVQNLFRKAFEPVRPSIPFICNLCESKFWNPVYHSRHQLCQSYCLQDTGKAFLPVMPTYMVVTRKIYNFLSRSIAALEEVGAGLPIDILNPLSLPTPSPNGGWSRSKLIQAELKEEYSNMATWVTFKDMKKRKCNKLRVIYSTCSAEMFYNRVMFYPVVLSMPFLRVHNWPKVLQQNNQKTMAKTSKSAKRPVNVVSQLLETGITPELQATMLERCTT